MKLEERIVYARADSVELTSLEMERLEEELLNRMKPNHRLKIIDVEGDLIEVDTVNTELECSGDVHRFERSNKRIVHFESSSWVS